MNTYQVSLANTNQVVYLAKATLEDIEAVSSVLTCDWLNFWNQSYPGCEEIIKLECDGKVQGLIYFSKYPFPLEGREPEYLEINALETVRSPNRIVNPVGLYLIWYAAKLSLEAGCIENEDGSVIELDALESAIDYYRDKVKMEGQGCVNLAPGEEGYAFRFTKEQAIDYCERIERQYGTPDPVRTIG